MSPGKPVWRVNGHWGASATFFDYDRDGFLDLYVVNYVDFTLMDNKHFARRIASASNVTRYGAACIAGFPNAGARR
jgi:hypothetical protein